MFPDRPLGTVDDVVALLGETINHVRRGAVDPKVGTAVGYLAGLLLKALEQGDLGSPAVAWRPDYFGVHPSTLAGMARRRRVAPPTAGGHSPSLPNEIDDAMSDLHAVFVSRLLLVMIFLCPSLSRGEDAGAVIAGMKTEAEECRYVLDICQRVRSQRELLKDEPDVPINSDARVRWDFLRSLAQADEERLRAALRAMQAKHSDRPKCLDECKDLGA